MPTLTAPADPDEVAVEKVAEAPALRVPAAILTKAATIVAEGAGGTTSWTAGEQKIITARLVLLLDRLLDAGLVATLKDAAAVRGSA